MSEDATPLRPIETLTKADGYVLLWKQDESGEWVADFGTLGTVTACLPGITHWTPVPRVRLAEASP